jgi:hypothetical protein
VANSVSPEYLGIETRELGAVVTRTGADPIFNPADPDNAAGPLTPFFASSKNVQSTNPRLKFHFAPSPKVPFPDGGYRMTAITAEKRGFGELLIARDAALMVDFHVRTDPAAPGLLPGSCHESCGGRSQNGTCWCDEPCLTVPGQCCYDKQSFCGGALQTN